MDDFGSLRPDCFMVLTYNPGRRVGCGNAQHERLSERAGLQSLFQLLRTIDHTYVSMLEYLSSSS